MDYALTIERVLIMEPPSLLRLLFDEVRFSVAGALGSDFAPKVSYGNIACSESPLQAWDIATSVVGPDSALFTYSH